MNTDDIRRVFIGSHLGHLWYAVLSLLATVSAGAQQYPAHRLQLGPGTVLLIPDSSTGLIIWATRPARPGHRPSPDFVGWIAPERVDRWRTAVRALLAGPAPDSGKYFESEYLDAVDGGRISVARSARAEGEETALVFGHARERPSWIIEAGPAEVEALLDSMATLARTSRLKPPAGVGYANPTNRKVTPDRVRASMPSVSGAAGEIWAAAVLDSLGYVLAGSSRILWASRPQLAKAMLEVLPSYAYRRKDGGVPGRLWVYQRVRVR